MLLLSFDREFKALKAAADEKGLLDETFGKTYLKAKGGSAKDQFAVACLYKKLEDTEKAFEWFLKSAEKEYADAEYEVANIIIENGAVAIEDRDGYSSRYENPEPWLERAWTHGNPDGAYLMACYIMKAEEPDLEKAAHWQICSFERGSRCDHAFLANHFLKNGDSEGALVHLLADAEKGSTASMAKAAELLIAKGDPESAEKAANLLDAAFGSEGDSLGSALCMILAKARETLGENEKAFECYEKAYYLAALEKNKENESYLAEKLGDMTYCGVGTRQNYTKAVEYFEKAESFTLESAKVHYADCKLRGLGTDKSVEGAAELGSPEALYKLYLENPEKEEYLFEAASKGYAPARYDLGKKCYENEKYGDALLHLLPVSHDYPDVPYMLGICLARTGEFARALAWFEICSENGDGESMYLVGKFALEGLGCAKDEKKAVEYFKKSAALGNVNGAFELGMCCKNGAGTAKNPARAMMLISAAADNGSAAAMFEMGNAMRLENKEKALEYYRNSAELGYESAMYQMGFLYEIGYVTGERELRLAIEWYGKCRKTFRDVKSRISALSVELAVQ